ncbi:hypothetical protein NC651_004506 [Populus alba x Populus x berolinensis]|nr:hypothetical protein NC651_004506 [Populus alba x Populus x berolinensis]
MKNLFFSMLFLLSFLFCLANVNEATVPCNTVDSKAAACLGFATVDDKKAICKCLKASGGSLGVKDQFLSKIPGACNIKVGFPVSTSVNCDAEVYCCYIIRC